MKVPYICDCYDDCNKYYEKQAGNGLPYYSGIRLQKGHGFFSNIMRMAIPFFKKGLIHLGKHGINTATNIINDVESGQNFKQSFKNRGIETAQNIGNQLIETVQSMNQQGHGNKRKIKSLQNKTKTKRRKIARKVTKSKKNKNKKQPKNKKFNKKKPIKKKIIKKKYKNNCKKINKDTKFFTKRKSFEDIFTK